MIIYLFQIFISLVALGYYRNNRMRYLAVITAVYFIAYYIKGEFDVVLSLYLILLIIGMGMPLKMNVISVWVLVWIGVYTIAGIFFQDALAALTAFVTRFGYIIIFLFMLLQKKSDKAWHADGSDYRFLVRTGMAVELLIIAMVWIQNGPGSRVIVGNQPIGAGIVTGLTVVIAWCFLKGIFTAAETAVYSIISAIIAVLSGTRGYMVIIIFPLAVLMAAYLLDVPGKGGNAFFRIGICCLTAAAFVTGFLIIDQGATLINLLRLDEGLGYRENENMFVREIMRRAPWYNQLLGFGFGGDASHVDGFLAAVYKASWNRTFMAYRLLTRTIFHNYWYTVLFKAGCIGLGSIIVFYGFIFRKIFSAEEQTWEKWILCMFIIGNIISLTFRITATCSMFEMLLAAFFIRQLGNTEREP